MSELSASLKRALGISYEIFDGFVTNVNGKECDVKVFDDEDSIITGVALRSVADDEDSGFVLVPAVGSHVVIAKIEGQNDYTLIKTSKLDKVIINCLKVEFNGGENEGLVKVKELEENINALKSYVEAINTALPNAFTAVGASTAANGASGASSYQGAMAGQIIQFVEMQNENVKH